MKKELMVVLACYAFTARSQVDQSKNFIYLFSDSVVYARDVSLRPDYGESWILRVDRRKVPTEQVKFVNNEDGFFANTRKLTPSGMTTFSERVIEGKINLYREVIYDENSYDRHFRHPMRSSTTVDVRNYYNKGFNDLKRVNYPNLATDMGDNVKSLDLLANYRNSLNKRNLLFAAAGASLLGGFVALVSSYQSNSKAAHDNFMSGDGTFSRGPNFLPAGLLFGAGIGFGIGGFAVHVAGTRTLESAIDAYNR